jgi:hypothetical protein
VTITGSVEQVLAAVHPIVKVLSENASRIREAQMVMYTPGQVPQAPMLPPSSYLLPQLLGSQLNPQLAVLAQQHAVAAHHAAQQQAVAAAQQAQLHQQGGRGKQHAAAAAAAAAAQQQAAMAAVAPVLPLAAGQEQILTIQINVPANSIGAIIGHRGQNIRDIRRQSGAEINVAENAVGEERSIIIKGNLNQNEMALYLIQSTLAAAPARQARAANKQAQGQSSSKQAATASQ